MGKKRSSDDSTESNPPVKISKVTEFSGTAFKTMLKEPSSAMNGEFIRSRCRQRIIGAIITVVINSRSFVYLK